MGGENLKEEVKYITVGAVPAPPHRLNTAFLFAEQEARQRRQLPGPRPAPRGGGGSALVKGGPRVESWGAPAPGPRTRMRPLWPEQAME